MIRFCLWCLLAFAVGDSCFGQCPGGQCPVPYSSLGIPYTYGQIGSVYEFTLPPQKPVADSRLVAPQRHTPGLACPCGDNCQCAPNCRCPVVIESPARRPAGKPAFVLKTAVAQELFDDLWDAGFRPKVAMVQPSVFEPQSMINELWKAGYRYCR